MMIVQGYPVPRPPKKDEEKSPGDGKKEKQKDIQ